MNFIGFRTLKTAVGATCAIIIAKELGLEYSVAAGIITVLSVQGTKKQSLAFAFQRIAALILAICISMILFNLLGYSEIVFGIFLLLFIPLAARFNLKEGIVVSSVLITHLLSEKTVNLYWTLNEMGLMLIGVSIALLLNLYMPKIDSKIKENQREIEEIMSKIFKYMAEALRSQQVSIEEEQLFKNLQNKINEGRRYAYNNFNNYLFQDASYYVQYMEMRAKQAKIMKRLRAHFQRFSITYEETLTVASFTEEMSLYVCENNTSGTYVNEMKILRESFKSRSLPVTREEFENRAMLYQFLNDLEEFIEVKSEFSKSIKDTLENK